MLSIDTKGGIYKLEEGQSYSIFNRETFVEVSGYYTIGEKGELLPLESCLAEFGFKDNMVHFLVVESDHIKAINTCGNNEEKYLIEGKWISGQSRDDALFNMYLEVERKNETYDQMLLRVRSTRTLTVIDWMRLTGFCYQGTAKLLKRFGCDKVSDYGESMCFGELKMIYNKIKPLAIRLYGKDKVESNEKDFAKKAGITL